MLKDILPSKNLLSDDIPVSELAKQVLENVSTSETKNDAVISDEIILAKASSKEIKAIYDMPKEEAISTFIGKPEVGD
jgi:chromatin segregation and condensation protein Rec8/ScpA/Scc1 (kleisin family)